MNKQGIQLFVLEFSVFLEAGQLFRIKLEVCNCESCQQEPRPVVPREAAASDVTVPRPTAPLNATRCENALSDVLTPPNLQFARSHM
jgi:hypothetical protein